MIKNKSDEANGAQPARFRDLSRPYLRREMHLQFIAELLLFGVLMAMSAWPMLQAFDAVNALPF